MPYEVRIARAAEREIDRVPSLVRGRINHKIVTLESEPRPRGSKKLSGREEYRVRVGSYRVLYVVDDNTRVVVVLAVGHRRDVYA